MVRRLLFLFSIILLLIVALIPGCDKYNVTEPRFYDADKVYESLPECPPEDSIYLPKVLPVNYRLAICWLDESQKLLKIQLDLPIASNYELTVANGGGGTEKDYEGHSEAGSIIKVYQFDSDDKGVFGVTTLAGNFRASIWFEVD